MANGLKITPGQRTAARGSRTRKRIKDDDPRLLQLIGEIYRTVLEPERWPPLLEQISALTGAHSAVQAIVDLSRRQIVAQWDHPSSQDPLRFSVGATADTEPQGEEIQHGLLQGEGKTALFSLFRAAGQGPFDPDARHLVELLVPHVQRATQLYLRLHEAQLQTEAARQVMARLRMGVLLVDDTGRVCFANPSAQQILAAGDGLGIEAGEIRASEPDANRELTRLVGQTAHGGSGEGGALALTRPSDRQALQLVVAPLSSAEILPGLERAVAAVFLSDPEVEPGGCAAALERLYGLTPCEARVALGVVAGRGLQDVADGIGVGLNTVRTHLQHVFQKSGTRRQTELVQLLLRGPLQLRLEP